MNRTTRRFTPDCPDLPGGPDLVDGASYLSEQVQRPIDQVTETPSPGHAAKAPHFGTLTARPRPGSPATCRSVRRLADQCGDFLGRDVAVAKCGNDMSKAACFIQDRWIG